MVPLSQETCLFSVIKGRKSLHVFLGSRNNAGKQKFQHHNGCRIPAQKVSLEKQIQQTGNIIIPSMIGHFKIQEKEMILKEFLCYHSWYNSKNG